MAPPIDKRWREVCSFARLCFGHWDTIMVNIPLYCQFSLAQTSTTAPHSFDPAAEFNRIEKKIQEPLSYRRNGSKRRGHNSPASFH